MSDAASDSVKYKWTPESTALLVSVWSDRQVQKQLEYAPQPQVIWENVARYMRKKGYNVGAKHCRSRMKQVLVCYKEAKQAGTRSSLEQYYETIDRVMKNKRLEQININGIDTVDATANMKSPPKDVKTNKNLQMRFKAQEPVQSLYRTDALSPTWMIGCENEYPDSPESNETIIARPHRVFSPTRDVAINTNKQHLIQIGNQAVQMNSATIEEPMREDYRQNLLAHYPYGEIPYQNTVQNVQNQIIQENMQQNIQQNRVWNQLPQQNVPMNEHVGLQQNVFNHVNRRLPSSMMQGNVMMTQNSNAENVIRQQNHSQRNTLHVDNRAMPQEPRKTSFGQNLQTDRIYKQYRDIVPRFVYMTDINNKNTDLSPDYSPDVSQNLNDAFCQSKSDEKSHNLNETYSQPSQLIDNHILVSNADATVMTNNATCNDDTLLLECLLESPTPSENIGKSRDSAVNTDNVPNAPFRKKKAQKLEQLVLSAINSQNEVVNKILAAQNDMVARFLDVDRDRQNRLEIRLDRLLNVVHATVHNKNAEKEHEMPLLQPSSPEPAITSLHPPPKPGMVPPKLDLVPPKPCRVPCTMPSSNVELINHNPISTRPGVVSPITSPGRKLGTIWSKLGPVSQSPFVKAQQRLGFQTIATNKDARTQSSAERRIIQELDRPSINARSVIYETVKLLEMERQLEEKIENARLEVAMGQTLTARRRLFTQREPTPIMILTAAFLDAECCACELDPPYHGTWNSRKEKLKYAQRDNLLAGQGEGYEHIHHLNTIRRDYLDCKPCDSSTPAKLPSYNPKNNTDETATYTKVPKQTIQQLARLVMNSARWREPSQHIQQLNSGRSTIASTQPIKQNAPDIEYNATFTAPKANAPLLVLEEKPPVLVKSYDVTQQKQSSHNEGALSENKLHGQRKFPMGFTTAMLISDEREGAAMPKQTNNDEAIPRSLGFVDNPQADRKNNGHFLDDALAELQRMCNKREAAIEDAGEIILSAITSNHGNGAINVHNRNMIEQYVSDLMMPKKPTHDKDIDSDNDEEFLDTTTSMHPSSVISRRNSFTSNGTTTTETARSLKLYKAAGNNCRIS